MRSLIISLLAIISGCTPQPSASTNISTLGFAASDLSIISCPPPPPPLLSFFSREPVFDIRFTDQGNRFDAKPRDSWIVGPVVKDFIIRGTFSDSFTELHIRNFKFEPAKKYEVKYERYKSKLFVWIEKNGGIIVFGERPNSV